MHSIHWDVHRRAGIAATYELLRDGHTSHQLTAAVRRGDVIRVRQGHYACPELSVAQLEAYRVGGRLTGFAGAQAHGIWTPQFRGVDIQVVPDARALRTRTDATKRLADVPDRTARVTWTDHRRPGTRSLAGPIDCLRVIVRNAPTREAFAAVESALRNGIITRAEWRRLRGSLESEASRALGPASTASESGGESLLRFDLLQQGLSPNQQVDIRDIGRVDFVLGTRLILEVDGAEFHSARADFEEDRRRDAVASTLDFRTLRFSYSRVERHDPLVMEAILAAVRRGDHL